MKIWLDIFGHTPSRTDHGPQGYVYCADEFVVIDYLKTGKVEELAIDSFDIKVPTILDWLDLNPTRVTLTLRPTINEGYCESHDKIRRKIEILTRKIQ